MTRHEKGRRRTKGATDVHGKSPTLSSTERNGALRSSPQQRPAGGHSRKGLVACAVYAAASLALVFLNRIILTNRFPFPLTLTWIQEVVGATLYAVLSSVGKAANGTLPAEAVLSSCSSRPVARQHPVSTGKSRSSCIPQRFRAYRDCGNSRAGRKRRGLALLRNWVAHSLSLLFPAVPLHLTALRRLLPVSMALVGMVALGNACLQRVQVSTYQVARSLTLVITLILQRYLLRIHVSLGAAISCGVVCFGFFIGSLDTTTLSLSGALTGSLSSLSQAMYVIFTRQALDHVSGAEAAAMYYTMVNASVLLPAVIWASGEAEPLFGHLFGSLSQQKWKDEIVAGRGAEQQSLLANLLDANTGLRGGNVLQVAALLVASGTLAFTLTISSSWIISVTSPVTFNVLGYAKACAQTIVGFWIFREKCTPRTIAGVALTMGGSAMFLVCKRRDAKEQDKSH